MSDEQPQPANISSPQSPANENHETLLDAFRARGFHAFKKIDDKLGVPEGVTEGAGAAMAMGVNPLLGAGLAVVDNAIRAKSKGASAKIRDALGIPQPAGDRYALWHRLTGYTPPQQIIGEHTAAVVGKAANDTGIVHAANDDVSAQPIIVPPSAMPQTAIGPQTEALAAKAANGQNTNSISA